MSLPTVASDTVAGLSATVDGDKLQHVATNCRGGASGGGSLAARPVVETRAEILVEGPRAARVSRSRERFCRQFPRTSRRGAPKTSMYYRVWLPPGCQR